MAPYPLPHDCPSICQDKKWKIPAIDVQTLWMRRVIEHDRKKLAILTVLLGNLILILLMALLVFSCEARPA